MANKFGAKWIAKRLEDASRKEKPIISCQMFGKHFNIPSLKDRVCRLWIMNGSPFVGFYLFGITFDSDLTLSIKILILFLLLMIGYALVRFIFDERMYTIMPMTLYLATKFWLYITLIIYYLPCN
jgi:palmitoyltransferase